MDFGRKQLLGIIGITAALAGLLVVPFLVQDRFGIDAFKITFAMIVLYAGINWYWKREKR